jgi:hypothetical protein
MPDLPQDHVIMGNPAMTSTWTTSYSQSFQDPKKEFESFKKACEAVRAGVVENHILDQIEQSLDSNGESSDQEESEPKSKVGEELSENEETA